MEDGEVDAQPELLGEWLGEPLSDAVRVPLTLPLPTTLVDTEGVLLGDELRVASREAERGALGEG